jgi:hypothetical protein
MIVILANITWPGLLVLQRAYAPAIILASLAIETFALTIGFRTTWARGLLLAIAANAASALAGWIPLMYLSIMLLPDWSRMGPFPFLAFAGVAACLNIGVEGLVLIALRRRWLNGREAGALVAANVGSAVLTALSLLYLPPRAPITIVGG